MLTFRMIMRKKGDDIIKNIKKLAEYSIMFSLITGLSSGLTKYLVNGPFSIFFKII